MKRWRGPLLFGLVLAIASHFIVLHAIPRVLMHAALKHIEHGDRSNRWLHGKRVTPLARNVVRPSPDLAYAICSYDLSAGPLHIHVPSAPQYWSLSLYAANSDNFAVWDDASRPGGVDLLLLGPHGEPPNGMAHTEEVVRSPSLRGAALIRRLVVDDAAWNLVEQLKGQDQCAIQ